MRKMIVTSTWKWSGMGTRAEPVVREITEDCPTDVLGEVLTEAMQEVRGLAGAEFHLGEVCFHVSFPSDGDVP